MDAEKYNRNVPLLCPTCGCTQFGYDKGVDETIEIAKCASCGRELTKDELIHENSENISEHVKEMGDEIIKDAAKEMKEALKNAFKGSKNIRVK
jgi:transcription initiation factor IIE alpha subunit